MTSRYNEEPVPPLADVSAAAEPAHAWEPTLRTEADAVRRSPGNSAFVHVLAKFVTFVTYSRISEVCTSKRIITYYA